MNKEVAPQKCRTCLKSSTKTFSLTKPVTGCPSNITYAQLLKDYAQFEFNTVYELHLPQYLCFLCCSQLKSTYVFIQQAQRCNIKLINDLPKFCLREQEIDLPELDNETLVSIEEECLEKHSNLEDQFIHNFSANEDNSCHEDNLTTDKSFIEEPILTTAQIIEYDSEDNLETNKQTAESDMKADHIIEYDFEDSVEIDNDCFSTDSNEYSFVEIIKEEEPSLSNKIETLESVECLQGAIQCTLCNKIIANHDKLINHMRIYHDVSEEAFPTESNETTFICDICLCIYNSKNEYLKHIKENHKNNEANQTKNLENSVENQNGTNKKIKCRLCDFVGKTYSGLQYHNRSKHGTEKDRIKCKFCSYTTLNKGYLLNHVKNVHNKLIKTLKANAIKNTDESINANTKNTLNNNCVTNESLTNPGDEENTSDNSNNEKDEEEFSDEDFIRTIINMKKNRRKNVSTKTLVTRCEECGKILKNYKTLCNHRLHVHKSEDMFSSCPYCDKKCKRETDLKIHIRQMHGPLENRQQPKPRSKEKRFMCANCPYTCVTSTLLKVHINRHHTGEKPYTCDICSKSFVRRYELKRHQYVHTGEKPYKCPICLKSFRDHSNMRKHKRLHTNKNPYTCDDCGKSFTQSYNLSVHKRTHLKENKLSCSICGKYFKNKSMLNVHQANENHYDEDEEIQICMK